MKVWIVAVAIVLFVEGLMLAVNPDVWKRTMRQITELPSQNIRNAGIGMISAAFFILFMLWMFK